MKLTIALLAVVTCTSGCITVSLRPAPANPIGDLACGVAAGFDPVAVTTPVALSICGASALYDLARAVEIREQERSKR